MKVERLVLGWFTLTVLDLLWAISRQVVTESDGFDVSPTPALGERPLEIGALNCHGGDPTQSFEASARVDGMPLGVQVVGRPADEPTLLALASQLEAARPWAQRRPGTPNASADAYYY